MTIPESLKPWDLYPRKPIYQPHFTYYTEPTCENSHCLTWPLQKSWLPPCAVYMQHMQCSACAGFMIVLYIYMNVLCVLECNSMNTLLMLCNWTWTTSVVSPTFLVYKMSSIIMVLELVSALCMCWMLDIDWQNWQFSTEGNFFGIGRQWITWCNCGDHNTVNQSLQIIL